MQIHQYVDTTVCRYISMQIQQYADTSVCRCRSMQTQQYVDTAVCRYINMQIQQYVDSAVCRYSSMQIQQYVDTVVCRYSSMQIQQCTMQIQQCVDTVLCRYVQMVGNVSFYMTTHHDMTMHRWQVMYHIIYQSINQLVNINISSIVYGYLEPFSQFPRKFESLILCSAVQKGCHNHKLQPITLPGLPIRQPIQEHWQSTCSWFDCNFDCNFVTFLSSVFKFVQLGFELFISSQFGF